MAGSPQAATGVKKLNYEGKPAGTGFITPLVIHNDTIYIAGQGAHSHDPEGQCPMDIETHTKKVMDNVKTLVETGNFAPPELCKPRKKADLSPTYGPTYDTQLMDPTYGPLDFR